VQEEEEEALMQGELDSGNVRLGAAYEELNRRYDTAKAAAFQRSEGMHEHTLSDMVCTNSARVSADSEKAKLLGSGARSSSGRGQVVAATNGMGARVLSADGLEHLNMVAAAHQVAAYHVQQSPLLTVAQYNEAKRKETKARRKVRVIMWPMLLYFSFILAAGYYFYTRIMFGMGGLTAPLRSYSYFVLFVEMLGAINMLFYACWLFARPVNTDVFPQVNENGAPSRGPMHAP
jgi:hypothetical protein